MPDSPLRLAPFWSIVMIKSIKLWILCKVRIIPQVACGCRRALNINMMRYETGQDDCFIQKFKLQ